MTETFVDSMVFCSLAIFLVLTKESWVFILPNRLGSLTPVFASVGYFFKFLLWNILQSCVAVKLYKATGIILCRHKTDIRGKGCILYLGLYECIHFGSSYT